MTLQKGDKYFKKYAKKKLSKLRRKELRNTPEAKAKAKAYHQRPEVKARALAYSRTLKRRKYLKEYRQRPEAKAKAKAYAKKYHQNPIKKDRMKFLAHKRYKESREIGILRALKNYKK